MVNKEWLEHPTVANMDKRKKVVLVNLMGETSGKNMSECIPAIMKANTALKNQGLSFTNQENAAILQIMSANMTPQEQQQFQMLSQMMGKMKK